MPAIFSLLIQNCRVSIIRDNSSGFVLKIVQKISTLLAAVIKVIPSPIRLSNRTTEAVWLFLSWRTSILATRLEAACCKALSYTPSPSYKNIKAVLTRPRIN